MHEISKASREQAESITQVTAGVDQISSVVRTNSATAQESAAASQELSGQAQVLKELVGQFQWKKESFIMEESKTRPQAAEIGGPLETEWDSKY